MNDYVEIKDLRKHLGSTVEIAGWVEALRSHGKVAFIIIRDGTGVLQCVVLKKEVSIDTWASFNSLSLEACLTVTGIIGEDDRAPGGFELTVRFINVISVPQEEFPIQPKEHGIDFLLDNRHLWLRSSEQRAGLKIRSEIERAIHNFYHDRGFTRIDTPILSGAIGESAGTLFETDYFGETAYLAQTGQLYVEAAAAAFRKVYCFGPTFRAEKSKTRRHLTEFWMVEPEVAFNNSEDSMRLQEDFVTSLVDYALENCAEELELLGRDLSILEEIKGPFPRISYTAAIDFLQGEGHDIELGRDLGAPQEAALSEQYALPLFVFNYPKEVKAFYMKENPEDTRTVLCNDLLAPEGYGEIIGGSQREEDYEKLLVRIREDELPAEAYDWYLDIRKYGGFPHSGFGLGLERTLAWITGKSHVREFIPFPRLLNRLTP